MAMRWIPIIRPRLGGLLASEESFSLSGFELTMSLVGSAARKIEVMLSCADPKEATDAVEAEATDMAEAPDLHLYQQSN